MDLKSIELICRRDCALEPDRPLVVGVSGGADSLALAGCLADLGYPVIIAHFNHQLRVESQADLAFVQSYALAKGLTFVSAGGDVSRFAGEQGLSIEESARQMRYAFLFQTAREQAAQALVVGHTADDQVETVLMHLLRGSGLDGLKGMSYRGLLECFDPEIPLVRPLLGVWREETETWCRSHGLDYRVDVTNADTAYARNRLRHELIPILESYNPRARAHIHRMAGHLAGEQRLLTRMAEEAFRDHLVTQGEGYLIFDREGLAGLDPALAARVIRLAAFKLVNQLRDFDSMAVDRSLAAVSQAGDSWQTDLPGGLRLCIRAGQVCLMTWAADLPEQDWPQIGEDATAILACPGELVLGGGWLLQAEPVAPSPETLQTALENRDPNQAWFDPGDSSGELTVKRAPAGQRLALLGMTSGSQKLSDFWVNVKLPREARLGWPVVYCQGELAWLPGFRLAQPFRVTGSSRQVIHLSLIKVNVEADL
jgi:tRNA(Ile)-lysidine synthase